jgi:hypothetical protein
MQHQNLGPVTWGCAQAPIRRGGEQGAAGGFSQAAFQPSDGAQTLSWPILCRQEGSLTQMSTTSKSHCAISKGQSGRAGSGRVERISAVAVTPKGESHSLESLHGSEQEALDRIGASIIGTYDTQELEVVFDGKRFDVVMVSCHPAWWPSSLLDVPPIGKPQQITDKDDRLERDGYSSGSQVPGQFMTREEALGYVLDHNRGQEETRGYMRGQQAEVDQLFGKIAPACRSFYCWAVLVEVGQRIDNKMATTAEATIRGTIGELRQTLVYPVRVAPLSPDEIERHKIETASEEPAVA